MGINTIFICQCGAQVEVEDFPVDEYSLDGNKLTKSEVIHMATQELLVSCPNCDPNFNEECLEFISKEPGNEQS